ncbi:hypothetical protein N7540_011334 [Penicillium herquei]|nr:hypothetical protein N7540_011334 [Penicillium herquei]
MFSILKPTYAIHTGVCAGRGNEANVKDVIFSQWAVNYEEGKYVMRQEEGNRTFLPSYEPKTSKNSEIAGFTMKSAPSLGYKNGNFASGSAVRLDAQDILTQLEHQVNRGISALDMEASAFLHTCDHMNIESLGVIKGVSDAGDLNRPADLGSYKAVIGKTADAIESWIAHRWTGLRLPTLPTRPGVKLADEYFSNYITKAVNFDQDVWTKDGRVKQAIQGLKVVLPPPRNPMGHYDNVLLDTNISAYRLQFACIGHGWRFPTALYTSGYLIDFPRVLRKLQPDRDHESEVDSFKNHLKWKLTNLTRVDLTCLKSLQDQ